MYTAFLIIFTTMLPLVSGQQLAVGGYGGCLLASTFQINATQVECWGVFLLQFNQQLNPNPPFTSALSSLQHIAMTQNAACGLTPSGAPICWGDAIDGIMNTPPVPLKQISLGNWNCGIGLVSSHIHCWGNNVNPLLIPSGNFTSISTNGYQTCAVPSISLPNSNSNPQPPICFGSSPTTISPPPTLATIQIATGTTHVCLLLIDNTATCYGSNTYGEAHPPAGNLFIQLVAGNQFTCGIRTDSTVLCFGINDVGQSAAPSGLFTQIAASISMICGLKQDRTAVCWGSNTYGEKLPPALSSIRVRVGFSHICMMRYDRTSICYGDNGLGQTLINPSIPLIAFAAGNQFTCTLVGENNNGVASCIGDNSANQITSTPKTEFFISIHTSSNALTICGVRSNNQTVVCWGSCTANRCNPPLTFKTNSLLSVGVAGTCGISVVDFSAVCWGTGTMTVPPASTYFQQITCGNLHCCGLTNITNAIVCWGSNSLGQCNVPTAMGPFTFVSAGFNFNCAVRSVDGSIVCWGFPSNPANQPSVVGNNYASVHCGTNVCCSVSNANQTVSCWGDTTYQLLTVPSAEVSTSTLAGLGAYKTGIAITPCALGRYSNSPGLITSSCSGKNAVYR
jgi:hypothetical protein